MNFKKTPYERIDEAFTENISFIFGEFKDENGVPYREVYRHEIEGILNLVTKWIESKYIERNMELASILKYECINAFGDSVSLKLNTYEKVIEEVMKSLNTRTIIEWEVEFDTFVFRDDGFPHGTQRTSKFTREEFLIYAKSSNVRLSPTLLEALKMLE